MSGLSSASTATTSVASGTIEDVLALGPVMPVLTVHDVDSGVAAAVAIVRGGLRAIEITLRTPTALEAIAAIVRHVPGAVVGAGTVLTVEHLDAARRAGASFAVSPGSTSALCHAARELGLPYLPGIATASELMAGLELGYRSFKLFPASEVGVGFVRAMLAPFPAVRFCPTGGIDADTASGWLSIANVACVGGSWIAPASLVAAGAWAEIEARARQATKMGRPQVA